MKVENPIKDPLIIANLIGLGFTLFIPLIGDAKLIKDPRFHCPAWFTKEEWRDYDIACGVAEITEVMKKSGGHREVPECSEVNDKHKTVLLGWKELGFTEPGTYIKFLM